MKPDYSEYLKQPGMLAWIEQEWKKNPQTHDEHARVVNEFIDNYKVKSVLEFGCGTGQLASRLTHNKYIGIDSNIDCIEYAKIKTSSYSFIVANIRTIKHIGQSPNRLVITFGFLKHFGLHEWSTIFNKVATFGEYFIFDMPIATETKDDGVEFHHVWKSMNDIEQDILLAGLTCLEIVNENSVEPIFICKKK